MTFEGHLLHALAMFFCLSTLLRWKCRHDSPAHRMRRGLRDYLLRTSRGLS